VAGRGLPPDVHAGPPPVAATGGCAGFHPSGQRPEILRPGLGRQARLLCNEAFEVLHSGVARVPIWSAQRLDAATLSSARGVVRENTFRADARLPPGERAELADYAGSGFDRGHMAPAGDMPSVSAQAESFLLSNMVPQVPAHNRGLWARIEAATRGLAARTGRLYVLTGIASLEDRPAFVGGRVLVPSHLFKAVFDPRSGGAGVWWSPNTAEEAYEVISLDALEARTGLRLFPAVSGPARARAMDLPSPRPQSAR
jgi:endonuclease G